RRELAGDLMERGRLILGQAYARLAPRFDVAERIPSHFAWKDLDDPAAFESSHNRTGDAGRFEEPAEPYGIGPGLKLGDDPLLAFVERLPVFARSGREPHRVLPARLQSGLAGALPGPDEAFAFEAANECRCLLLRELAFEQSSTCSVNAGEELERGALRVRRA